jgi:hypothetical protein
MALEMLLGYQATSLDFEHPPELAQDLLYVTVARIQKMLLYGHSAAFLFKVGEQTLSKKQLTCVITMNPDAIAKNPNSASRYMLAVPDKTLKKLSPDHYLNGLSLLNFIIDHEVSHCLDSYYNGANPMSMKDLWGQYMHFQREIFSDTFAMVSHINSNGKNSPFIKNFINYRKLCLFNGDPGCCTANALEELLNEFLKSDNIPTQNLTERIQLASQIRNKIKFNYNEFENYYFSSIKAMALMGISPDENYAEKQLPEKQLPDEDLVLQLINQTRQTYQQLFHEQLNVKIDYKQP